MCSKSAGNQVTINGDDRVLRQIAAHCLFMSLFYTNFFKNWKTIVRWPGLFFLVRYLSS